MMHLVFFTETAHHNLSLLFDISTGLSFCLGLCSSSPWGGSSLIILFPPTFFYCTDFDSSWAGLRPALVRYSKGPILTEKNASESKIVQKRAFGCANRVRASKPAPGTPPTNITASVCPGSPRGPPAAPPAHRSPWRPPVCKYIHQHTSFPS